MNIGHAKTGLYKIHRQDDNYDILLYIIKDYNVFIKYGKDDDVAFAPARFYYQDINLISIPITEENLKKFPQFIIHEIFTK